MLSILLQPEIKAAIGILILSILTFLAAWIKKTDAKKEDSDPSDGVDEVVRELKDISQSLKTISVDLHDITTVYKIVATKAHKTE